MRGLVLAAPFIRDRTMTRAQRRLMGLMRIPFLTLPLYMSYFPRWEPRQPRVADFDAHLARIVSQLGSDWLILDGVGHHPHVEQPAEVAGAVCAFAERMPQRAGVAAAW